MLKNELTGQEVTNEELHGLSDLVKRQIDLESTIRTMSDKVSELQEQLKQLSEGTIPDLLLGMGLSQLKMQTG